MSFREALQTELSSAISREGYVIYKGKVSEAWSLKGIPQGGYAVGIILSAAAALQASTPHPDIIHVTAHFLQPVDVAECEIHMKRTRQGKNIANIDADLVQNGTTKISTRLVYGVLPDMSRTSSSALTLAPPSPLARRIPLTQHPAFMRPDKPNPRFLCHTRVEDRAFAARNATKAKEAHPSATISESGPLHPDSQNGILEWGAWTQLDDQTDALGLAMLPFFADATENLPALLPRELQPGPSWFATVVLTVEFKSKIPSFVTGGQDGPSPFSARAVGLYSSARFMSKGRHDAYVEIWTAPSTIGERLGSQTDTQLGLDDDWREKQVCLAVSTQMALTIPEGKSRRGAKPVGSHL